MSFITLGAGQAQQDEGPLAQVVGAFAAAPQVAEGWTSALGAMRQMVGGAAAELQATQGSVRWTVARSGRPSGPIEQSLVERVPGAADYQLVVSGMWDADGCARAKAMLALVAAQAGAGVQAEMSLRAAALQMTLDVLKGAGFEPLVCRADGAVASGAPQRDLRLKAVGGRLRGGTARDDEALRATLARVAETRRATVLVLGGDDAAPLVVDVLPAPQRNNLAFDQLLIVLPRGRAGADEQTRQPLVRQLFGLTPSEAAVAVGIAAGSTVTAIAERRGVAASTVRAQLKTILAKVGVRRQVELAHRVAAVC